MNDKELELLRELAAKLGTTAEHMWGVLVAQGHVKVWTSLVNIGVLAALVLLFAACLFFTVRAYKDACAGKMHADWALPFGVVGSVVLGLCALVGVFLELPSQIHTLITAIHNPEYLALQEILRTIR